MKMVKLEKVDKCPKCNHHFDNPKRLTDYNSMGVFELIECPICLTYTRVDADGKQVIFEDTRE